MFDDRGYDKTAEERRDNEENPRGYCHEYLEGPEERVEKAVRLSLMPGVSRPAVPVYRSDEVDNAPHEAEDEHHCRVARQGRMILVDRGVWGRPNVRLDICKDPRQYVTRAQGIGTHRSISRRHLQY